MHTLILSGFTAVVPGIFHFFFGVTPGLTDGHTCFFFFFDRITTASRSNPTHDKSHGIIRHRIIYNHVLDGASHAGPG